MPEPTVHAVPQLRKAGDASSLQWLDTAVDSVEFNFTNECNLRCVYCPQGTHEEGFHAETSKPQLDSIIAYIKKNEIKKASVGYYGETTLVEGWQEVCQTLIDLGVRMTIVSNFARVLTPREIEVFAQFEEIQVSIDTVDQKILRRVRKAVDVRTIIYNSQLIQAHVIEKRLPMPRIVWTGVLTSEVVMGLSTFVAAAASCGIRNINFNSVAYFDGAQSDAIHVCDMPDAEFIGAVGEIERALELAKERDICMKVQDRGRMRRRMIELTGKSRALDNGHYLANLDDLSFDHRIYVYGSGAPGRYIAGEIKRVGGLEFRGFLDSTWSGEIDGSPVLRFDAYLEERQSRDLILVCSGAYDQIEVALLEANVDGYLDARDIYLQAIERSGPESKVKRQGIQGSFEVVDDGGDDLPAGLTRLCDSPWTQVYTDPKGEVYSCCQRGDVMGVINKDVSLPDVLNGDAYRQLRRELLTGKNLNPECSRCVGKAVATPEKMQDWIRAKMVDRKGR